MWRAQQLSLDFYCCRYNTVWIPLDVQGAKIKQKIENWHLSPKHTSFVLPLKYVKWVVRGGDISHSVINIFEHEQLSSRDTGETTAPPPSYNAIFPNHAQCGHTVHQCNINMGTKQNCLTICISVFGEIQQFCLSVVSKSILDLCIKPARHSIHYVTNYSGFVRKTG